MALDETRTFETPRPPTTADIGKPVEDAVADLLTLVITTSPTPSAPSTDLLSQILASFREFCPELVRCRVILVLDTYDHISSTARLKKGHVTAEGARNYAEYKNNAKRLILDECAAGGREHRLEDLLEDCDDIGRTSWASGAS